MPISGILNKDLKTTDQNKMEKALKIFFSSVKRCTPDQSKEAITKLSSEKVTMPFYSF